MRKVYKIISLIFICFPVADSAYEQIFQSKDIMGSEENYQNPEWSLDSKLFTVQMHMGSSEMNIGSSQIKTFKLYLGKVSEQVSFYNLTPESSKKNKSKFGKSQKVRESNLGWLDIDSEYFFYGTMDKYHKIRECSIDDNSFDMYPVEEFEDQDLNELGDLELTFPLREYTISKNNIYFTTYADPRRVWLLNDEYRYSVLAYLDQESKQMLFDIPVVSLSVSPNDDRILLVSYNENQSEIIRLDKDDDSSSTEEIKIYKKTNIKKPESDKMNYLYGILDPHDNDRYLLIARKQSDSKSDYTEDKNLADVFIMNGENIEGKFIMYRSLSDQIVYNNPEIQFHPTEAGHIYFIDIINGNKSLSYWNGEKVISTSLELEAMMNFKFSPDGKYLLATTRPSDFGPRDLYLYEVTE